MEYEWNIPVGVIFSSPGHNLFRDRFVGLKTKIIKSQDLASDSEYMESEQLYLVPFK